MDGADPAPLVGHVRALFRYPVKSMAAEPLQSAEVGWHGIPGDRRWAFIRAGMVQSGFPWLTIRQRPDMWRYRPRLLEPDDPDRSRTVVQTPSGATLDVADPALAAELGDGVGLVRNKSGIFDTATLSIISVQTIARLGAMLDTSLDMRRFRPSIVVDAPSSGDFPEDGWIGRTLRIGGLRMRVDQRDERCVMINVDPASAERDARVLRAVARARDGCLGVYGSTVAPGRVAVGDPVHLDAATR
jgi:uncharacterized protein YcbX